MTDSVTVIGSIRSVGEGTGLGTESANNRGGENILNSDTTIQINQFERNGAYTLNHIKDTTVKKSDVEKINQNREYKNDR